jgi:hypothetical protein
MSRTLKRPMFRRGGSTNNGIMSGLKDRQKYSLGDRVEEITAAMDKYAPIQKTRLPIGQLGLNLASGKFAGDGFLQNLVGSLQDPYASFVKAEDARKAALDKRKASAVGVAIAEQSAKDLAKIKAKSKDFYAAQTPEEQFKVKSKIYAENKIPQIRNNATNIANFEVRHRDKPYVQLGFVYSNKTKKFEPNFAAIPSGTITFNPEDNFAYKREGDKFIKLDPITLLPIENVDGTE